MSLYTVIGILQYLSICTDRYSCVALPLQLCATDCQLLAIFLFKKQLVKLKSSSFYSRKRLLFLACPFAILTFPFRYCFPSVFDPHTGVPPPSVTSPLCSPYSPSMCTQLFIPRVQSGLGRGGQADRKRCRIFLNKCFFTAYLLQSRITVKLIMIMFGTV